MASLRQIRRRIRSVENTKKITRAMEMVAAAKLRRFEDLLTKARESAYFLEKLLKNLLKDVASYTHPLFGAKDGTGKIVLVVATSDTGLCGTYNSNLLHAANAFLKEHAGREVEIVTIGKTGLNYFRRIGQKTGLSFNEIRTSNFEATVFEITEHLKKSFLESHVDEVYLLYTQYISKSNYKPRVEKFLNLEKTAEESGERVGYILEPSAERIFDELLPRFLLTKVRTVLLEAFLSEQLSRMVAMRQATDNAVEMIEDLTLLRNKLRQASITKELIEVVSGAKAAKK